MRNGTSISRRPQVNKETFDNLLKQAQQKLKEKLLKEKLLKRKV